MRDPSNAREILAWLEKRGTRKYREGMARYGIVAARAFGVPMSTLQGLAKRLGKDHELAAALWKTGWYEARLLAALVDEPERVTPAQMNRWCREFENWADCDTACFFLFDRTPHAFGRVAAWSRLSSELGRRAAFALLASLALHDRESGDAPFRKSLALVEKAAKDERNFVKKGVSWALRAIGGRSRALHAEATAAARRLADSDSPAARWVGRDASRQLASPATARRIASAERSKSR